MRHRFESPGRAAVLLDRSAASATIASPAPRGRPVIGHREPPAAGERGGGDEPGAPRPSSDRQTSIGVVGRTRVAVFAAHLVLLVAVGVVLTLGIGSVMRRDLHQDTNGALQQEIGEIADFVEVGRDPLTGRPFESLGRLLTIYLDRNTPSTEEAFVAVVNGEVVRTEHESFPISEIPADVIASFAVVGTSGGPAELVGRFDTATGQAWYHARSLVVAGERGSFVVSILPESEARHIRSLQKFVVALAVAAVLIGAILSWLSTGRLLAPLKRLTAMAGAISDHDSPARLSIDGPSEAAEMASTVNAMLDRLRAEYTAQVSFVQSAGHELRAPLTVVSGHLELLVVEPDPEEQSASIRLMLDELARMGRLIDDLQTVAVAGHDEFVKFEDIDGPDLVHDVVAKGRGLAPRLWRIEAVAAGTVVGDRHRLTQALLNLMENAVHHTTVDDEISIGLSYSERGAALSVADTGSGIDADEQSAIFDRFVRGRGAARMYRGSGLGLAIVRSIAEAHGGNVELISRPGEGTRFTLFIPNRPARCTES